MSADPIAETLAALWSPLRAITTQHQRRRSTLDAKELTIFLADVVGGGRHRSGELLTLPTLCEHRPKAWLAEWAARRERQVNEARRRRGLG